MSDALGDGPFLTPLEVSRFLAIPEATLADWRYRGKGPDYHKLNGLVRYDRDDVNAWLTTVKVAL